MNGFRLLKRLLKVFMICTTLFFKLLELDGSDELKSFAERGVGLGRSR
jgi:hypothetical protein